MKLTAVLACRNQSSRLYAKPLQNLDVEAKVTILDYMLEQIALNPFIDDAVLAISQQKENDIYEDIAKKYKLQFVRGDDLDVLSRLVKAAQLSGADNILRVTSESPFVYYQHLDKVYNNHCSKGLDYSIISGLPDGAAFEIINFKALKKSWDLGSKKHRSELCTLYIFENQDKFKIEKYPSPAEFNRLDMRLTVDWPEDLIVMREIYKALKLKPDQPLEFRKVIEFLDQNPKINAMNNWISSGKGRIWY